MCRVWGWGTVRVQLGKKLQSFGTGSLESAVLVSAMDISEPQFLYTRKQFTHSTEHGLGVHDLGSSPTLKVVVSEGRNTEIAMLEPRS